MVSLMLLTLFVFSSESWAESKECQTGETTSIFVSYETSSALNDHEKVLAAMEMREPKVLNGGRLKVEFTGSKLDLVNVTNVSTVVMKDSEVILRYEHRDNINSQTPARSPTSTWYNHFTVDIPVDHPLVVYVIDKDPLFRCSFIVTDEGQVEYPEGYTASNQPQP